MAFGRTNAGGGGSFNKSVIIVTAPTGSTVTCSKGDITKNASEKNGTWTFTGLEEGTWTIQASLEGQEATNEIEVPEFGVYRVTITYRVTPEFTYTGDYEVVTDDNQPISDFAGWKDNWKIRFLTSGTLTILDMHTWNGLIDVFLVGGGGGGVSWGNGFAGPGGGGGYTKTHKAINITATTYSIVIGAGGNIANKYKAGNGGATSAFSFTANGGSGGGAADSYRSGGPGGSGGGGLSRGSGGVDGGNGGRGSGTYGSNGGAGQGTTTREFGNSSDSLYSTGGTSGSSSTIKANTGNGGHGGEASSKQGGSGIVIIRNTREEA